MAGNHNSGRKPKTTATREIEQGLKDSALIAKRLLHYSLRGTDDKGRKFKPLSMTRIKECELVIAHAIGSPRQKVALNLSGEVMTLNDIAKLAFEEAPKQLPEPDNANLAESIIEGEYQEVTQDVMPRD